MPSFWLGLDYKQVAPVSHFSQRNESLKYTQGKLASIINIPLGEYTKKSEGRTIYCISERKSSKEMQADLK